jgi:predicted  nucleic acid-binding Zn-ribbon protein
MEDTLKQILAAVERLEQGQNELRAELKEFRDAQEVTTKLLTGDTAGIKTQLRDMRDDLKTFRRDIRDWTRKTDEKIDTIEDRLDGVRDALDH